MDEGDRFFEVDLLAGGPVLDVLHLALGDSADNQVRVA